MFKNSLNNDWKVIIIYIYVRKKLKLYYTIFHNVYSIFRKMPKMLSKAEKLSERKGFRIRRKMLLELSRQHFKLKCSLFNFFSSPYHTDSIVFVFETTPEYVKLRSIILFKLYIMTCTRQFYYTRNLKCYR